MSDKRLRSAPRQVSVPVVSGTVGTVSGALSERCATPRCLHAHAPPIRARAWFEAGSRGHVRSRHRGSGEKLVFGGHPAPLSLTSSHRKTPFEKGREMSMTRPSSLPPRVKATVVLFFFLPSPLGAACFPRRAGSDLRRRVCECVRLCAVSPLTAPSRLSVLRVMWSIY